MHSQYYTRFLARRGQGLLGMFVCLFVCDSPSLGGSYVRFCDSAPSIWIFFPIFFFLGGGRRDVRFFSTTPARERGYDHIR